MQTEFEVKGTTAAKHRETAKIMAPRWANVKGLRSNWSWLDADKMKAGSVLIFYSKEACDLYKKST